MTKDAEKETSFKAAIIRGLKRGLKFLLNKLNSQKSPPEKREKDNKKNDTKK